MSYRVKLLVFLVLGLTVLFVFNVGYSALNTLSRLDVVEAQRDQWQRPADVIQALQIRPGDAVADIGCGSGYFALKLSSSVGSDGEVFAEDIRRLPLVFLWFRTIQKNKHNVRILHGDLADPHLPTGRVNDVLIANTYHEFTDPQSMLQHVWQSLVSGGRLVVVDRAPNPADTSVTELAEHEISAERVESDLQRANLQMVTRNDHFIEKDPDQETWWLIVARKP